VTGRRIGAFLDRDGTINEEVVYLRTPEQLRLIAGVGPAIRSLNQHGLLTCVISNQSGVARGFLSESDLTPIHAKLEDDLRRSDARIDRIYYCPHHPTEGRPPYDIECACRKPAPGMLLQGARELGIDLRKSFVVGDRIVDVQAGKAVGAATILVLTGYGATTLEECRREHVEPDYTVPSIVEAIDCILQKAHSENATNR
jgi:D-glycero-D-manno-heptose 1,7-bisphosphate phosphatase